MKKTKYNSNKAGARNTRSILFSMQNSFHDKKTCKLCECKKHEIDYKNITLLKQFISDGGRILSRRLVNLCDYHQRMAAREIRKARFMALIPFCD